MPALLPDPSPMPRGASRPPCPLHAPAKHCVVRSCGCGARWAARMRGHACFGDWQCALRRPLRFPLGRPLRRRPSPTVRPLGAPMRARARVCGHCGVRSLLAPRDIAIGGHAARIASHPRWRRHCAGDSRAPCAHMCRSACGARPICGAIVRRVRYRRGQHQRLPAGLVEDCLRGGVRRCGRRTRQEIRWQCDAR